MIRYIKCPRCELNYIDPEKQEVCDVCLKELKGIPSDMDEIDEEEDLATELCPVCGENMMRPGEKMCEECRKKAEYEEEPDALDDEDDAEWREYLDDDTDADLDTEIGEIGETFDEEEEPDEDEEYEDEPDDEDLEYVTGDEIYTLSGDDDDEDDEKSDDDDF